MSVGSDAQARTKQRDFFENCARETLFPEPFQLHYERDFEIAKVFFAPSRERSCVSEWWGDAQDDDSISCSFEIVAQLRAVVVSLQTLLICSNR